MVETYRWKLPSQYMYWCEDINNAVLCQHMLQMMQKATVLNDVLKPLKSEAGMAVLKFRCTLF